MTYIDIKIADHLCAGGGGEEQPRDLLRVSARTQVPGGRGPGRRLCPGKLSDISYFDLPTFQQVKCRCHDHDAMSPAAVAVAFFIFISRHIICFKFLNLNIKTLFVVRDKR